MATTSPDNIKSPDAGDQYALVQDLGALADTVQLALNRRPRSISGVVPVTASNSPGGTANVQFPPGSFTSPPLVMLTKQSAAAAQFIPYALNVTANGFTAGIYSGSGAAATQTAVVGWVAFEA